MVSILKNLDLLSARETYKALLPGTKPKIYQQVPCTRPRASGMIRGASMGWSSIDPDRDYLKRIEPLGPAGAKLDPWHGVEPDLVKVFCECGCRWERRTETPEEKEDRRLRELGEAVPTAFWLKDPAHA
ncbi:hypothetical protein [Sphingomonas sp.]|uniref:hypothetical protein n=1 Tax=Sphingomonas sp. TaxID=28214 RepID=UPI0031D486F9